MTVDVAHPRALDAEGPEGGAKSAVGTLSRRRVVQGALWATPVVLVATALPATAASVVARPLGGLALASTSANQNSSQLTVTAHVAYTGIGGANPAHPVTAVQVKISVPLSRVVTGNGTTASAGWTFANRTDTGGNAVFTYTWNAALSSTANLTAPLIAVLPKSTTRTAFNITVQAHGVSNLVNVTSSTQSVAVGAYSVLTLPSGLTATRDALGTNPRYMRFVAPVLNSSATNSAAVVGLVARITVPSNAVAAGTPSATAGTWTYAGSTTSGSNTIVTFNYTPGTLNVSGTATPASFRIPMVGFLFAVPTVTIAFEGKSPTVAGAVTTVSASDSLAI